MSDKETTLNTTAEERLRKSEERFRSLVTATAQQVWTTDARGEVVEDLPSWREFTGQSRDEIMGSGWLKAVHPDDRERSAAVWSKAVESYSLYESEFRVRRHDGEYRDVRVRGVPVLEKDGSIREWVGILDDITEHKKIELEQRLQAVIFNNIAEGICLVRAGDAVIVYTNSRFEKMFGYGPGELNGKPVSIVNYSDKTENAEQTAKKIMGELMEKGMATYDVHNVKKDGTPFWCRATTSTFDHPVFGKVFVAVQGDITELKQADEILKEKMHELEIFNEAAVGRELKMEELRKEIERLKAEKPG